MKRYISTSQSRFANAHALTLFLYCAGIACLLGIGTPRVLSDTQASKSVRGTLTFAERVAYQFGIEDVYWRHRIWPKDNEGPKPPLDAMMSVKEVEKKVTNYLRKSQLLADKWQQPITTDQLQAEMDRMAQQSKQPEMLRELFAALGNDPLIIAECLARPILAERMVSDLTNDVEHASFRAKSGDPVQQIQGSAARSFDFAQDDMAASLTDAAYSLPKISNTCADDTWTATTTMNAPDAREFHTAVWTGSEMIIWGGFNFSSGALNTGARYNPAIDSWTATTIINAPSARTYHTGVWTGSEMIVWGGYNNGNDFNSGGRYDPNTDTWISTSTATAPSGRESHTAVWTGNEMIVWGGLGCGSNCRLNTGARYNPSTDSWTATSTTNAPSARAGHTALWAGSEIIVWGGSDQTNLLHTGGRYSPTTNSWTATGLTNVPLGRIAHTAVWNGNEMIVWGGVDEFFNLTNTGGRYYPSTDSWIVTNAGNGPSPRSDHSAVWTGSEMIVWGGESQTNDLNTGGRYNPATDSWTLTTTANVPFARGYHTAVWIGNEMIVWGGVNYDVGMLLNTGGNYCAQPSTVIMQSAISRKTHGFVGVFDIALPLNGTPGIECRSGGSTNDYTIMVTFSANVTVNGNPQAAVTSGIGTIGIGGVSNGGSVLVAGNLVTIPLTNVGNAQTIQVTLYGVNGSTNFVIPMRILIGDTNGNGIVNASDVSQTKSRIGQQLNGTNFRCDVTANGFIDSADIALVKSSIGTGLP